MPVAIFHRLIFHVQWNNKSMEASWTFYKIYDGCNIYSVLAHPEKVGVCDAIERKPIDALPSRRLPATLSYLHREVTKIKLEEIFETNVWKSVASDFWNEITYLHTKNFLLQIRKLFFFSAAEIQLTFLVVYLRFACQMS